MVYQTNLNVWIIIKRFNKKHLVSMNNPFIRDQTSRFIRCNFMFHDLLLFCMILSCLCKVQGIVTNRSFRIFLNESIQPLHKRVRREWSEWFGLNQSALEYFIYIYWIFYIYILNIYIIKVNRKTKKCRVRDVAELTFWTDTVQKNRLLELIQTRTIIPRQLVCDASLSIIRSNGKAPPNNYKSVYVISYSSDKEGQAQDGKGRTIIQRLRRQQCSL